MLGSSLTISRRTVPMTSLITWIFIHPTVIPVMLMVFMNGGVLGSFLQFRKDYDHGKNGK
ncbi:Conserved protein [Lacticaseibacillus rhamnosus Lc 705]|nr:Conserved protein [Lacticaseibacillus rhamnosus Lc 705]